MKKYTILFSIILLISTLFLIIILQNNIYNILIGLLGVVFTLLIWAFYLIHTKKITNSLISGILIFLFIILSILAICFNDELGFSNINDFITSAILLVGIILSLFIYLINKDIISSHLAINFINKIPEYIPFSHTIRTNLLSLIRVKYKVIVLIRTLNDKNSEWVLTQISAFNNIIKNQKSIFNEIDNFDIDFFFVDSYSDDVNRLLKKTNTVQYRYIIITSLSSIFRDAILSRENLEERKKKNIQIIGALSSINDKNIKRIIDRDDDIIRIFPPDYDEAKTAIDFMFSKIKSSICTNKKCELYHKKNNIIIMHNGTYGRAVRDQCQQYYNMELSKIYNNTTKEIGVSALHNSIGFYSFDYKSNGDIVYDGIESKSFDIFLNEWEGAKNQFFIIGYEPNISFILKYMNNRFQNHKEIEKSLLICGTASMKSWRDTIVETVENSKILKDIIDKSYYLKLLIYNNINTPTMNNKSTDLNLKFYKCTEELKKESISLENELEKIIKTSNKNLIKKHLDYYLQREESYISIFSTLSILIAQYAIEHKTSLLKSKSKILKQEYRDEIDILVNGDSINQYIISSLLD